MKLKRGMLVETEYASGTVVAITKQWVIVQRDDRDEEMGVYLPNTPIWLPAEFDGTIDVDESTEVEVPNNTEGC